MQRFLGVSPRCKTSAPVKGGFIQNATTTCSAVAFCMKTNK